MLGGGALIQAFFVHFAKNSGRKKTQVLAIFGEIQPIFCKTQVKFSEKGSGLLDKNLQKLQKGQVSGYSQVALSQKSGQKKA